MNGNSRINSTNAVTRLGSAWHVSSAHIVAPYRSFSREKIPGIIGAYIGLMHVNITLKGEFIIRLEKLNSIQISVDIILQHNQSATGLHVTLTLMNDFGGMPHSICTIRIGKH